MNEPGDRPPTFEHEAPGRAVEFFEGLWVLATRHHGGGFSRLPEANNRAFILRLTDAETGQPGLLVLNATDPEQSFSELDRLRGETGLEVTHVVSCGAAHHAYLAAWHDRFPGARVLVGDRVARLEQCRSVMERPGVSVMDPDDPFPSFRGQLDALSFTGLRGPAPYESPSNEGRDSWWATLGAMRRILLPTDAYDQLWVHHVASQTILAGENLAPYYTRAAHAELSLGLRWALSAETISIARTIHDRDAVSRSWERVVAWPARHLLGYHDCPGGGFVGDVPAALREVAARAGQLSS